MRRSQLTSGSFVTLYTVALGAVALSLVRGRWGEARWYPMAVGVVAAGGIIVLTGMAHEAIQRPRRGEWMKAGFFGLMAAVSLVGAVYLLPEHPAMMLLGLGMAGVFAWGTLGLLLGWPGFREECSCEDVCVRCGYDLTGNVSGVCPECGERIGTGDI